MFLVTPGEKWGVKVFLEFYRALLRTRDSLALMLLTRGPLLHSFMVLEATRAEQRRPRFAVPLHRSKRTKGERQTREVGCQSLSRILPEDRREKREEKNRETDEGREKTQEREESRGEERAKRERTERAKRERKRRETRMRGSEKRTAQRGAMPQRAWSETQLAHLGGQWGGLQSRVGAKSSGRGRVFLGSRHKK